MDIIQEAKELINSKLGNIEDIEMLLKIIKDNKKILSERDASGIEALEEAYTTIKIMGDLISRLVDRLEWKPIDEIEPNTRCILTFNFVDAYTGQLEDDGLWYDGSYGIPTPTHWLPLPPVGDK